jgi:predicted PurR-regulated permease PerM
VSARGADDLGPPPRPSRAPITVAQRRALGALTAVALLSLVWIAAPVGVGLLLGALVAFALEPLHQRLTRRYGRPALSAALLATIATLLAAAALVTLGAAVAERGAEVIAAVRAPDGGAMTRLEALERRVLPRDVDPAALHARLRDQAAELAGRAAASLASVASATLGVALAIFFLALTAYFVLRNWRALARRAELGSPPHPLHTRLLFDEFRRAGRVILVGTVGTGAAQGALASLGYAIFGVPHPLLLGALTAAASLLPAVGTAFVWGPIAAWLFASDRAAAGAGLLVFSAALLIGLCDYVIRPRLVGRGDRPLPTLLTFVALFGGAEVFGPIGLVLGPVIASLAVALLRTWEREAERRRAEEPRG